MAWIRFDKLNKNKLIHRLALSNYEHNTSLGIRTYNDCDCGNLDVLTKKWHNSSKYSSITEICGKRLLRCQYSGNFSKMKFSVARMSNTCCEVIAVYNALVLSGKITDDKNFDAYFKLASEFVVNGLFLTKSGFFGSSPKKISSCLGAYGQEHTVYTSLSELERNVKDGDIIVVSYRHHLVCMHTYCCVKLGNEIVSINRGSGCLYEWKNKSITECLKGNSFIIATVIKSNTVE